MNVESSLDSRKIASRRHFRPGCPDEVGCRKPDRSRRRGNTRPQRCRTAVRGRPGEHDCSVDGEGEHDVRFEIFPRARYSSGCYLSAAPAQHLYRQPVIRDDAQFVDRGTFRSHAQGVLTTLAPKLATTRYWRGMISDGIANAKGYCGMG